MGYAVGPAVGAAVLTGAFVEEAALGDKVTSKNNELTNKSKLD